MPVSAKASAIEAEVHEEQREIIKDAILTAIAFIGLVVGIILGVMDAGTWLVWSAFGVAYLAGGLPATIEALRELRKGSIDINLLMVLAALAAAAVGEPRDGAILLFLFSLAGTLEAYAMGNTKKAVVSLMKLRPDVANRLLPSGQTEQVSVEILALEEKVVVRPGERVPIDGVVLIGSGAVDQSSITGESVPADKVPGDLVFAGTVNGNAVLTVRVTKKAEHSTLARMILLVTEAQSKRSPSERFGDWFGQRYTIAVLVFTTAALGVFFLLGIPATEAFYKAATLLVVASPCAIVISVPAAVLSALAAAARNGVLFKGGAALEQFGSVTTIAFDKTGTLTEAKMKVVSVVALHGSENEVLITAAAIEQHSEHPLAESIRVYVREKNINYVEAVEVVAIPGKGLVGNSEGHECWVGNRRLLTDRLPEVPVDVTVALATLEASGVTPVVVGRGSNVLGLIGVADTLRSSSVSALATLVGRGVARFAMLTGDTKTVAHAVGANVGIAPADIYAELLPEDKVRVIQLLQKNGPVAFVGDGVNDAAALATANVGVAMGAAGTDVAIEAADVALLSDDLERLTVAHMIAQKANAIIKQNLIFAIGIMLVMVGFTLFGDLPLPLGVIGHEGGTLLVVLNGLRLLLLAK